MDSRGRHSRERDMDGRHTCAELQPQLTGQHDIIPLAHIGKLYLPEEPEHRLRAAEALGKQT